MNELTFTQTRILALQTIIVVLALIAAAAAAWYARRAAETGDKELTHAREVSRAELRPWLTYAGFEITEFRNAHLDGQLCPRGLRAVVQFLNTGKSPAVAARLFADHVVTAFDAPPPRFEVHWEGEGEGASVIGLNRPTTTVARGVPMAEADGIIDRSLCLWLYAYASYQEPGHEGPEYETEVTMRAWYDGENVHPDGGRVPRFVASLDGPQNRVT